MAPPANATHVVLAGNLAGGEEFAFGWWAEYTSGSPANFEGSFAAWVSAMTDNLGDLASECLGSGSGFTAARAYLYAGGSTQASAQAEVPLSVVGITTPALPLQCAAVVTIRDGSPGRRHRNRMYLPMLVSPGASAAPIEMAQTKIDELTRNIQEIFNAGPAAGFTVVVCSPTYGAMQPATSINCDSRIDTQRRRAESLVPSRNSTKLVNNT